MHQTLALTPSAARRWPIYGLFIANAISLIGSQLSAVAIPWFVLATTGSAARAGLTAFCEIVPTILVSFFGGTLVDRLGYRRTSILADLLNGVPVALIPTLHHTSAWSSGNSWYSSSSARSSTCRGRRRARCWCPIWRRWPGCRSSAQPRASRRSGAARA